MKKIVILLPMVFLFASGCSSPEKIGGDLGQTNCGLWAVLVQGDLLTLRQRTEKSEFLEKKIAAMGEDDKAKATAALEAELVKCGGGSAASKKSETSVASDEQLPEPPDASPQFALPPLPETPDPAQARALNTDALASFKAKDFAQAAELWTRAIEVGPSLESAYGSLAYAYLKAKRYDECIATSLWCDERVESPKSLGACLYNRGVCQKALGDNAGAIETWQRSLVLRENKTVRKRLSEARRSAGSTSTGSRVKSLPRTLPPENPRVYLNGARTAQLAFNAEWDKFEMVPACPTGPLSRNQRSFDDNCKKAWDYIGWRPGRPVACTYWVHDVDNSGDPISNAKQIRSDNNFTLLAGCDIDGDGVPTIYQATREHKAQLVGKIPRRAAPGSPSHSQRPPIGIQALKLRALEALRSEAPTNLDLMRIGFQMLQKLGGAEWDDVEKSAMTPEIVQELRSDAVGRLPRLAQAPACPPGPLSRNQRSFDDACTEVWAEYLAPVVRESVMRCTYWVQSIDNSDFTLFAGCDIDGDGVPAIYRATRAEEAERLTAEDVF